MDLPVATVTGLRVGRYTFRLTVSDQQGATDSASLTVRVQEGKRFQENCSQTSGCSQSRDEACCVPAAATSRPPAAHASGSHSLTLPNNSLVLRGSVSDWAQAEVRYLWVRDGQSPAAGVGAVNFHLAQTEGL